jgi:chromosome segregation ATPase
MMETWIGIVVAFLGGSGLVTLTSYLRDRQRDKAAVRMQERQQVLHDRQQPIDQYERLVGSLVSRIEKLEGNHEECMDQHIECERKVGRLEGQIAELSMLVRSAATSPPVIEIHQKDPIRGIETIEVLPDENGE